MSGESPSIQEVGGAELARHYPDKGVLANAKWYWGAVRIVPQDDGALAKLRSVTPGGKFAATISTNADGCRVCVPDDEFAIFIPWTDARLAAERGGLATDVRLVTNAAPSLSLELALDDAAVDDLFRGRVALPPPRKDAGWLSATPARIGWLVLALCAAVGLGVWIILR